MGRDIAHLNRKIWHYQKNKNEVWQNEVRNKAKNGAVNRKYLSQLEYDYKEDDDL